MGKPILLKVTRRPLIHGLNYRWVMGKNGSFAPETCVLSPVAWPAKCTEWRDPQASALFPTVLSPEQTLNNHELAPQSSPWPPRPPSWRRYLSDNKSYPQGNCLCSRGFFWIIFQEQYVHKIQLGEKKGGSCVKMKRQFKSLGKWANETAQQVTVLSSQG